MAYPDALSDSYSKGLFFHAFSLAVDCTSIRGVVAMSDRERGPDLALAPDLALNDGPLHEATGLLESD